MKEMAFNLVKSYKTWNIIYAFKYIRNSRQKGDFFAIIYDWFF